MYESIDPMTLSEEEDPEDYVDVVPPPQEDQDEYIDVPPPNVVSAGGRWLCDSA